MTLVYALLFIIIILWLSLFLLFYYYVYRIYVKEMWICFLLFYYYTYCFYVEEMWICFYVALLVCLSYIQGIFQVCWRNVAKLCRNTKCGRVREVYFVDNHARAQMVCFRQRIFQRSIKIVYFDLLVYVYRVQSYIWFFFVIGWWVISWLPIASLHFTWSNILWSMSPL